jgi:dinuclear metal center YbgI/SA1388 family protein
MAVKLKEIAAVLERIAPSSAAESWDNVGLQVGDPNAAVARVWVALDPSPEVIRAARKAGIDLLVTHHPLLFRALQRIDLSTPIGAAVGEALRHGLNVVSLHSNLDAVPQGLNDLLGRRLGLQRLRPLSEATETAPPAGPGIGRIGDLARPRRVDRLARDVKQRLNAPSVRAAGALDAVVRCVAVSTGSGRSLVARFLRSEAEVFISGDLGYHEARAVEEAGRSLIDVGHFHSEHLMKEAVAGRLTREFARRGLAVRVEACPLEKDPFILL